MNAEWKIASAGWGCGHPDKLDPGAAANAVSLAKSGLDLKDELGGVWGGNRSLGKRSGVGGDVNNAVGGVDEDDIERHGRILHPERLGGLAWKDEQHAVPVGQRGAVHQAVAACLRGVGDFYADPDRVAGVGMYDDLGRRRGAGEQEERNRNDEC